MKQIFRTPIVTGNDAIVRSINKKLNSGIPLSVHELAEVRRRNPKVFETVVSSEFKGIHETFGKRRFSRKGEVDRNMERSLNLETIQAMERAYQSASSKTDEKKKVRNSIEEEFIARKQEYLIAKQAYEDTADALAKAEAELKAATEQEDWYLKEYLHYMQVDEELKNIVLVHPSASLNQLKSYQHRIMVMTNIDAADAAIIGSADEVFEADYSLVDTLPYDLIGRDWTVAEESAIAFASMVIYYYVIEERNVAFIFADKLIAEILRLNGIEV